MVAALELFAARGYAATSVSQVAAAAGVQSQSLYHAFGSKEGLLAAAMDRAAEDFFRDLQPAVIAASPEEALALMGQVFTSSPLYLRLHLVLILERADDAELLARAAQVRRQGRLMARSAMAPALIDLPEARRERALDDLSRLLLMMLDGAFIERQVNPDEGQFERLFVLVGAAMQGALNQILLNEEDR